MDTLEHVPEPADDPAQNLRARAERLLRASPADLDELSPGHVRALVHELQVHQIELEIQNEELRRSQCELARAHDRYAELYDFAPIGYLTFDADGVIVEANVTMARMLGIERDALVGSRITHHVQRVDQDVLYFHRHAVEESTTPQRCELQLKRVDGSAFPVQLESVREERGDGTRCRCVVSDITARCEAAAAQREAEQRRHAFLATLAHELRNPLAPIRNALEVLERIGADSEPARQARALIDHQLTHMVRLIDDLMDVNRITLGRVELKPEALDLTALLREVVGMLGGKPCARHASLTVSLPDVPLMLDADPARLSQVFLNLLDNACKYTHEDGHIGIVACRDGDEAVVTVSDDGVGIEPEELPHVFEMFSQGRPRSGMSSMGGLGIGLWLAAGLVSLHGGTIKAFSDGCDQGSRFVVRLPLAAVLMPADAGVPEPDIGEIRPLRILIADDDTAVISSMSMLLSLDGHTVFTATDGRAAIDVAERERPDVALLDIGMPELDGYEVCRHLRRTDWGRTMSILAMTGWGGEEVHRNIMEAGFDAHLVKPAAPKLLRRYLVNPPRA